MIKTLIIVALSLSTTVLGISTGFLTWQRVADKAAIASLTKANVDTNASIQEIVDFYNQEVASGRAFSDDANANLTKQLDSLVADYNVTSSTLASTQAKLDGSTQSVQNLIGVIDELNAANAQISKLKSEMVPFEEAQKVVNQLNTANSRITQLEAELAIERAQ